MARNIDETELLAWIEGEAPADVAARIEQAMRADAALRTSLEGMRRDRALLVAWGEAPQTAPSGLVDAAIEQAERRALVGADVASDVLASIRPARRSWRAPLAAAASIALLGGAAWVAWLATSPKPATTAMSSLETRDSRAEIGESAPAEAGSRLEAGRADARRSAESEISAPETRIALGKTETDSISAPNPFRDAKAVVAEADDAVGPAAAPPALGEARAESAPAWPTDMPRERAQALLAQSMLGVVVMGPELERADEEMARVAAADADGDIRWMGEDGWSLFAPRPAVVLADGSRRQRSAAAGNEEMVGPPAPEDEPVVTESAYLVDLPAEIESLERVLERLRSIPGARITLESLSIPASANAPVQARDVLWWGEPISRWRPRAVLSVRIEAGD